MTRITKDALDALMQQALARAGVRADVAASVSRALVAAEADGQKGHGLSRIPSYTAQVLSGKVDGQARPNMRQTRSGTIMIDARHGFAYPCLDLAIERLPALATSNGIAAAGIYRSHHAGVVGRHVERLAERNLIALAFANTPAAMPAHGGKRPVFGTNPIAFACPQADAPPLVVDLALSVVARGKIMMAARKGDAIPDEWACDADGNPTTDAKAAMQGTLRPAGGAKGAALALMVELLAAALIGARLGPEATSFFDADGGPPEVGQTMLVIDPAAFGGADTFAERAATLMAFIGEDPGVRLPGTRRLAARKDAQANGIKVDDALLAEVEALGR